MDARLGKHFPGLGREDGGNGSSAPPSRLAQLRKGIRALKPAEALGMTFVWRILSGTEKQDCLGSAVSRFAELGIPNELRMYSDLEDELAWQILWRAMRDTTDVGTDGDARPFAKDVAECRDMLSIDERDALLAAYLDFEEEASPPLGDGEVFFEQIRSLLKKNESATHKARQLISYGSRTLATYLATTAGQQSISPTGRSDTGTNSDESSPSETETAPMSEPENPPSE
jgi:hypothetical protein